VRNVVSALAWGLVFPLLVLVATAIVGPPALLLLMAYPLQVARLALTKGPRSGRANWYWAFFIVLSRFSETVGFWKYVARRLKRGPIALIEYK
jgi:hypothetical protein